MEATMTRRGFGKILGTFGLMLSLGWSMVLTGCASFATILAWVNTGLDAFGSVVDLLAGNSVITIVAGSAIDLIIKAVKAAIADIGTAVDNYNAAPAASQPSLVGKISAALVAAQNEIAQFWNDLNIPDPKIASTTAGLLGLIVSTLAGFMTLLPPPPVTAQLRTFPKRLTFTPQKRSVKEFKSEFNTILATNGYSQYKRF